MIVIRDPAGPRPRVLMGQRGRAAAFMPGMFVFPGGAVDPGDGGVRLATGLPGRSARALGPPAPGAAGAATALAAAAIRELWEEAGLALGVAADWPDPPAAWRGFAGLGLRPAADRLRFVFRAITPPGLPRRFDARFFLLDAAGLAGDPDDFSRASDELSALEWIPLSDLHGYPLAFITELALVSVLAALPLLEPPGPVPFLGGDEAAHRAAQRRHESAGGLRAALARERPQGRPSAAES